MIANYERKFLKIMLMNRTVLIQLTVKIIYDWK